MGAWISVFTGSMDVSVQPGGGVSLTVQLLVPRMNTSWVPPVAGNVRVVVNGGICPGGNASAATSPGEAETGLISTRTQSTPTAKVVPGAGVPVTTLVTSKVAQFLGTGGWTSAAPGCTGVPVQLGGGRTPAPALLTARPRPAAAVLIANATTTIPRTTETLVMVPPLSANRRDERWGTLARRGALPQGVGHSGSHCRPLGT